MFRLRRAAGAVSLKQVFLALRIGSLLALGPIALTGSLWTGFRGGLLFCPFPLPFLACGFCPIFCTFGSIRTGLFFGILGLSVLSGRTFCGLFCPGGAAQDVLFKLPVRKLALSPRVDQWLRVLKYLAALFVVLLILEAAQVWPGIPLLGDGWFWLLGHPSLVSYVLIALFGGLLLLSIFLSRAWCRYLCPLGAWLSPFNHYSLIELTHDEERCQECGRCSKECSAGLRPAQEGGRSAECLRCLTCYAECDDRAFAFKVGFEKFRRMKLQHLLGLVALASFVLIGLLTVWR